MAYINSKKNVMATYEVLRKYSSYDNPISKVQIEKYLKSDYELEPSRNTTSDTLNSLVEFYGDNVICCRTVNRLQADGEEGIYTWGYYFNRDKAEDILSDEEIAILIDVCLYARHLKSTEAKKLINRLKDMATKNQKKKLDYIDDIPEKQFTINKKTSDNLLMLRDSISKNRYRGKKQQWVSFYFNHYDADKKLVPSEKRHLVFPLRVCEANHKYYLICAMDGSGDKLYHYRIDLMTRLRKEERESNDDLWKLNKRLRAKDISEYMSTHLYMFYDNPKLMKIIVPNKNKLTNMTFMVDAFGVGSTWKVESESDDDEVTVSIRCSPKAMKVFIMQYASLGIRVVEPKDVREQIEEELRKDCENILKQIQSE